MAKRKRITVDVCGHEATGTTKTEAKETAMRELAALVTRQHDRVYRFTEDGAIYVLYYTLNGWGYDIFRKGYVHASSCFMSGDKSHVLAAMERHVVADNESYRLLALDKAGATYDANFGENDSNGQA